MSLLKSLFGGKGGEKRDLTAREGYELAHETLKSAHPTEADNAYLCCMYTSVFDSNVEMKKDGTSRAWHFDFFLPQKGSVYLARVQKGKLQAKEVSWEKTGASPVEYIFAKYGAQSERGNRLEPPRLGADWQDSPAMAQAIYETLRPYSNAAKGAEFTPIAFCYPAEHLRYLQEEKPRKQLGFPPAPEGCFGVICSTDELYEEDSYLVYVQAATARALQAHVFRFPDLFSFGNSINW